MNVVIDYPFSGHVRIPGCFDSNDFSSVQKLLLIYTFGFAMVSGLLWIYNNPRYTFFGSSTITMAFIWIYREATVASRIKNCLKKKGK